MSPGELRAEKPDDVLFAGSAGARAVDACEVELLFDNADGAWPDLPFAEVAVTRKLVRGGEGQYLINRAAVRRIDLVELLSDVGLGGGLRSVISQGRVETVLNSRPAERRQLVEEAAGLGRFKRRRHRAELKLARVAIQVERARDLEDEVTKRLRPLALQATAAERAEKVAVEIAGLQAALATLDLARLAGQRDELGVRRAALAAERKGLEEQIAGLVAEREQAEEELTDSAGSRERATAAVYLLRSSGERLVLRRETAAALAAQLRARARGGPLRSTRRRRQSWRLAARETSAAAQAAAGERARLQVEAEERWARVAAIERQAQAVLVDGARGGAGGPGTRRDAAHRRRARPAARAARRGAGARGSARVRPAAAAQSCSGELVQARNRPAGPSPAELGLAADAADAAARGAARERDDLQARAALAAERLAALEQSLAEREGLPPAARALAEAGERLVLQLVSAEPGRERAVAAALGHRASAVVADDAPRGLELIERARASGLGPGSRARRP